ncbi:CidA/LrgA family protein [Faecalibacterium sp. An77]|uniref:CidA/LrgA family protein n=1 Tax=Faecalibacterium sp. An77 TaxID=1965655 RepID=UPI000B3AD548|nr:CidA/LrgA family protein [Faecalibacterium sp. An77]
MRYLRQFLWIIGFTLAGEVLHAAVPLPVPAAVWGLVLLFAALESGKLKLSSVQDCGQFLLGLMPVLFIAPSVDLMDSWPLLASVWPAVLAIIVLSTVVVFAVSGLVTQGLLEASSQTENAAQAEEVSDE